MSFSYLTPVNEEFLQNITAASHALKHKVLIHTESLGLPDLSNVKIAIIGVSENRNNNEYPEKEVQFNSVRSSFYKLFPGNWSVNIADLGDVLAGAEVSDTYFALQALISELVQLQIIPVILGGSQDLTYANYRALDELLPMVNLVNVDSSFDFGNISLDISNKSYMGKIIVEEPHNLFNYTTIGYQTYFNSQEEIDLMEKLYFEAYRLGDVSTDITAVEPLMRDANIVSIDLKSVRSSELSENQKYSPNGFTGKEICAISRYAGISNKVNSFGVYEYNMSIKDDATSMLIAQMLWYFIEGVDCRIDDGHFENDKLYQKFNVLIEEDELIFYKSLKTGRWWIEIPFLPNVNNKLKKHTLLPCTHSDYKLANQGEIPERWYKAYRKNSF